MKVHAQKLAQAAAATAAISYGICALVMSIWPVRTLQLTADLMHRTTLADVLPTFQVTPYNFLSGLIQIVVYSYLIALLFGTLYNRAQK